MNNWNIIGLLILAALAMGLFTIIAKAAGVKAAVSIFAATVALTLIIGFATGLMTYGNPCFIWIPLGYEDACWGKSP